MFCFCFLAGWGHSTETRPGANVLLCCLCNNTSSKELLLHKHCHEDGLSCWHGLTPLLTNCCTNICLTTERQVSNLAGPGPHMAHFQPVTSWMWDSHPAHRTWTTCKLLFYTSCFLVLIPKFNIIIVQHAWKETRLHLVVFWKGGSAW